MRLTPLGALLRGMAAGAVGSAAQSFFFKSTTPWAPATPEGVFAPPEEPQKGEMALETVARRFSEGMMVRPLSPERKKRAATAVHFAFGSSWGGIYGLARESFPALQRPAGMMGFSTLVWIASDNVILPAFKLAAWPSAYPARTHLYAWTAHLAYGLAVWAAYEALRPQSWAAAAATLWALGARRKIGRRLPRAARPIARAVVDNFATIYAKRPAFHTAAAAWRS